MGQYYIYTQDGVYYELDATTEINTTFSGEATDYPLESGEVVSDHYVNNPNRISFTGIISDVKSAVDLLSGENTLDTRRYIDGLLKLKTSKVPFTIQYAGNLNAMTNCVFESIEITQDAKNGYDNGISSYRISFTAKQIRFGEAARILSAGEQDPEFQDIFSAMESASGNTQEIRSDSFEEDTVKEETREEAIERQQKYLERLLGLE